MMYLFFFQENIFPLSSTGPFNGLDKSLLPLLAPEYVFIPIQFDIIVY